MSMLRQASTILPSSKRSIVMPEIVIRFPVGAAPRKLSEMRHLPRPTRHHLVALRYLVFNGEPHVGERRPVQLNGALHPSQTLRRVGIVWIVVHDIRGHQIIQPLDRAGTPDIEDRACRRLVVLGHRSLHCSGEEASPDRMECRIRVRLSHKPDGLLSAGLDPC